MRSGLRETKEVIRLSSSELNSSKKILVVEDNDVNRELMREILEMSSYEVLMAKDGEEGVSMAKEHKPDLILMDIQLPKIDGLQATRIIKADDSTGSIPVIALTAYAMKGDENIFLEAGCCAYIPKPISVLSFLEKIKTYLDTKPE